jgi:hypothetical protein
MKQFLKKRWPRIPVGILTVAFAICLLTGGVVAAYQVWSGTATVTVHECFSVSCVGGDGYYDSGTRTWTVSMYPGETKSLTLRVTNAASVAIPITLTATEGYTSIDAAWAPAGGSVPANSYYDFILTVTATAGAVPELDYTIPLTISRG